MKAGKDYIGVGVGVAIFEKDGKIFLMQRGKKSQNEIAAWALPGGKVEFGQTLKETAIREIREELGVTITITGQVPCYDHILPEENQHWVTTIFTATITEGVPTIQEPDKCSACGWFSFDKLPSPIAHMSRPAIEYFINQANKNL